MRLACHARLGLPGPHLGNRLRGRLGHGVPLAVHLVLPQIVHPHRLKRARPHVQGDGCALRAHRVDCLQDGLVEVQPRRGRRHRAGVLRIHRLVALHIVAARRVGDVGRQGHRTVLLQQSQRLGWKLQFEQAAIRPGPAQGRHGEKRR